MRNFTGNPIIKQNLEELIKVRDCAIAFVQYIDTGGSTCGFTDRMIDEVIDSAMKLKANRDYVYSYMGRDVPTYNPDGTKAKLIIN